MKLISLFTGAGGLDLGFEAAGFQLEACVELEPDARKTLRYNRPGWNLLIEGDVHRLSPDAILQEASCSPGEVDVIVGGPPCQPFSKAAFWSSGDTKRLNDPRSSTLEAFLSLVEFALPKALVIENVRGLAFKGKDEGLHYIRERLSLINQIHGTSYRAESLCLNAVEYGAPQLRERVFVVAFRDGTIFEKPAPTHSSIAQAGLKRFATAWDAIGGVQLSARERKDLALKGKWADLLPSIPEGQNYLFHTSRGEGVPLFGWRTRYWSFLLKLAKALPSWTIQASPGPATGPFHWSNRLLSIDELARLQGFPSEYGFAGSYGSARRQIGNAVPPVLAEAVARKIRAILCNEIAQSELIYQTQLKSYTPPPKRAESVPTRYLPLIGEYDEHPGTGCGPRAKARLASDMEPEQAAA